METFKAATSAPIEIQQNQLEVNFWQLRQLFNEQKRVGSCAARDNEIATLVAKITEDTKVSGLVYFSQHENLTDPPKSTDVMTIIHETWSLLERQVERKAIQSLPKEQIVSCLKFMKSLCTITKNTDKHKRAIPTPTHKSRVDLIWLAKEHASIEILCHLFSFILEYRSINKGLIVNSKTERFAQQVSLIVLERLLKDENPELLDENHFMHYSKFKFGCKASEIAVQDLRKAVNDVLLKVIGKTEDLNSEERGFRQEVDKGLFYILSVRTAEDYNFAFQIFLAHSQSDQATLHQIKESNVLSKIIKMLFQTKDTALVLSILNHPQMSKPNVAFFGCERDAEHEFQFQNALLFRIAKQLCSIRTMPEKQAADVEMSAFDDQEPELILVQVVNEEPLQREAILDSQVQKVITRQIADFLNIRMGQRNTASLEVLQTMIRNLLTQSIQNPIEHGNVVILDLFIYANLRYSVMSQRSWLLDDQNPQNFSAYIEYVKELFKMLDKRIVHQQGGKQVEVTFNYKTKLIIDVLEKLHFPQTQEDQGILVFGQRLTDSGLIQAMLPIVLARNGDVNGLEQNDCLILALIRLITKILDNAPNLISQYLNHGEENSVIKSIFHSLSNRLPQAQTFDKCTLSVLIDFFSIILKVADGKEYLKNSVLIKMAIQDKLNPRKRFFLGDLVYPQSNVSAQAVINFQKDLPNTFKVINENFNQSIIQLEGNAKKLLQIYVNEMQNTNHEPTAIQLLESDAASHNFRVRSQFIIGITDAFTITDIRQSNKLIQIFLQAQSFRKIIAMFNTIALLPTEFTNETRVLEMIRPMVNDENITGGASATTVFIENVKASIMDLNTYTNSSIGQVDSIDDLTSESNVLTTSECVPGIHRSTMHGRKLELKLRLRLVLHYTNTLRNFSERNLKRFGSYDFRTEITVLSQLFQLFDRKQNQVLNEIFEEQTQLSKEICSRHANKLEQLKASITTDIAEQKKWNDTLSLIGASAALFIEQQYGEISQVNHRYLLKFLIENNQSEDPRHVVPISDQETNKQNLRSIGEMCASFAKKLQLLSSGDRLDALHYNASIIESLNFIFVTELKMVNGILLMSFWKHGGIAALCKFYQNMVDLQALVMVENPDKSILKALIRLSVLKQREIVALILVNLLNCPQDTQSSRSLSSYKKINYETECGPEFKLLNLKHFFFNFYNQFLQNLKTDLLQQRGQIKDLVYETLTDLVADQFSTIIDAAQFERQPGGRDRERMLARQDRVPQREAPQVERDPTAEEISVLENMGYESYLAGPALRMAGFQLNRAVELLLGPQHVILQFIDQRDKAKEAEQKLLEAQELAMAIKLSEGNIDDKVEQLQIISIEEFTAIIKARIPLLFKLLLQANESTLISSKQAIRLVKKLAVQLKEDSFQMWEQLKESFAIMVKQLKKDPLLLSKLQQHLEVYVNLLGKMKPSVEEALALKDIKAAGTFLLQCLDSQISQQCLYQLQEILCTLQNIPGYFDETTNDYLLEVLKTHDVIRPTLDLSLIIACKTAGQVKESSQRSMLALQYIRTLKKQPVGSKPTDALAAILTNYSAFGEQQISQVCEKVIKSAFVTVSKLREAVLTNNKKQVTRIESGELDAILTKYKLNDILEQLQKVTGNEQLLLAQINKNCQVNLEKDGEYTVQFQQALFNQTQSESNFDELVKNKDQFKSKLDEVFLNQLKLAQNHQISTFEEILGLIKDTVNFRLEKISQFKGGKDLLKNEDEQKRASSQASESLINIFGCVADLIQLSPSFIVVVSELVKEKSLATWLIDDFYPSVAVNIENKGESFLFECKSLKIQAIMQSLTCFYSLKNEEEWVLVHDLRSKILIAATNSLKNNKTCQDNLSKARVIAALAVVRSCILMREDTQMQESYCANSTLEMLHTSFIADLQDCFAGETQQFNLDGDAPQDNLRNAMIELAIDCLEVLCQKIETWKTRKHQAKKQAKPDVVEVVNQIAAQAEQMQQDINDIIVQQQEVPELIDQVPIQQDDDSSSDEMDDDAPEEDEQSDEYGEIDHMPEEDAGDEIDEEQDDEQIDPVPNMAFNPFELGMGPVGDSDDSEEAMLDLGHDGQIQVQVGLNRIPQTQINNLGRQAHELLALLGDREPNGFGKPAKHNPDSVFDCIKPPTERTFSMLHTQIQKAYVDYQRKNSRPVPQQVTLIETRTFNSSSNETEEQFMLQFMRDGRPFEMPEEIAARLREQIMRVAPPGMPLDARMGHLQQLFQAPMLPPRLPGGFGVREEDQDDIMAEFIHPSQMEQPPPEQQRRQQQSLAENIIQSLTQIGLIIRQQDPEQSNEEMKQSADDGQMEVIPRVPRRRSTQEIQSPLLVQGNALQLQPQPEGIEAQAEQEVVQLQQPIAEPLPIVEPAQPVPVEQPIPVNPIEEMKEAEPMTFGVPNSVLSAQGIDPSVLEFLPEDMRIELLRGIQWQPAAVNNNGNIFVNDPDEVDQEFMLALPESIRQELEAERAARNRQQAQPVEDNLATFIATIIDPRVRAETLIGLQPEQIATLPEGLRQEAEAAHQRHAQQRAREQAGIAELMRQQQRQMRGPNAAGQRMFGMRDRDHIDEIDEIQARYLQDKDKLIEAEFKANPEKLVTPNQASSLLEKVKPLATQEQTQDNVGSQVEIQMAANPTTVQSILSLIFKTTMEEGPVDDVVARFAGRLIPLLSSMTQIKSVNNYLNRIKVTNCLTALVSQQFAEEDSLLKALVDQSQDHNMEQQRQSKAPIVIFIVVKLLSQMNRNFVTHLLQQFLFKNQDFTKISLQICLPVQKKKPESPLLVEILSYINLNKGKGKDATINTVLHHIMQLVFGNFDLVIDDVIGSYKQQIGTAQIEILIEALKLQTTSKKLLASFANVLIHIAGINSELWSAVNQKCYQDAVNVLQYINSTFDAIELAFGDYKPQNLGKTESEMFKELTLQRNDSQMSADLNLVKPKSLMKGEEQSLQQMLKESGDALCVLRNVLCLLQHMTPADGNQDERSQQIKATQLKLSESNEQTTYLQQLSDVLQIVQATKSDQNLMIHLVPNVICAFELYLPEIIATKKSQEGGASADAVKMVPVTPGEQSSSNIFGITGGISDRLKHFGRFCLYNKRIINKLISAKHTDPELNKLVAQVPILIDFENKKAYFKKEMTKLNQEHRQHQIPISVKRTEIFQDAYRQLNHLSAKELRGKLRVSFAGEQGSDAGGVSRDFYTNLSRSMFKVEYSLFKKADNGVSYCCNEQSDINPDHLAFFKFIGRMVGKAVCDKQLLDCYFTKSVYKCMLGQALCFDDLYDQDMGLFKSWKWLIDNEYDPNVIGELNFTADQQFFGRSERKNLITNGASVAVTEQNKYLYVEKHAFFKMYTQVKNQMDAFLKGFHELMPLNLIQIFTPSELMLLISGLPTFDLDDLKKNTEFSGYDSHSQVVIWLFEILGTFKMDQIGLFLQFVTGSSKIPMEGFCALQGNGGPKRFEIMRNPTKNLGKLPSSHTCFNQIELPEYPSKEVLQKKLELAITGCSEIDNI